MVIIVVILGGLVFGYWEKHQAGRQRRRHGHQPQPGRNRKKLQDFRSTRFQAQTTAALAAGDIDADLASTRFALADSLLPAPTTSWPVSWSTSSSRSSSLPRKAWS